MIDFDSLTYDGWYAWTLLPLSDPAWQALPQLPVYFPDAVIRALIMNEPLVAAYQGGGGNGEAQLYSDTNSSVSLPGAVLSAAVPLQTTQVLTILEGRVEVAQVTVNGELRRLLRCGNSVIGYLTPTATATIAPAFASN